MSSQVYAPQCTNCGSPTDIQGNSDFSGIRACPACGLTIDESNLKMQEELTRMFNQNMNFSNVTQATAEEQPSLVRPAMRYSISQHYIQPTALPVPTSRELLEEQGINSSSLSSSQLNLFENAASEQQNRLIELWKISPPTPEPGHQGSSEHTTVEREEELARMRYEKSQAEGQVGSQMEMATNTAGQQTIESQSVEPYMKSGYEVLAERDYNAQVHYMAKDTYNPVGNKPAFDPCFSGREWWRDFVGEQPMEFQYGMLDHFREVEARKNEDEEML